MTAEGEVRCTVPWRSTVALLGSHLIPISAFEYERWEESPSTNGLARHSLHTASLDNQEEHMTPIDERIDRLLRRLARENRALLDLVRAGHTLSEADRLIQAESLSSANRPGA